MIRETDQLGLTKQFEYDSFGRLTAVVLPQVVDPNTSLLTNPRYEYEYDSYGNQTLVRDPKGRETTYAYDEHGRQTSRTLPLGPSESFEYDQYGRQVRHTDMEGRIIDSVFSSEGFLDELQFFPAGADPDVDTPTETVDHAYDDLGRRTSTTDSRGTTNYAYDDDGRVTQIASPEGTLNYEYDATGRRARTSVGDPADPVHDFTYMYDGFSRLETVSVVERNDVVLSTAELTTYEYDLVGNLTRMDHANGIITEYTYDSLNRLDVMTHYAPDATPQDLSDNDNIAQFDYVVRADGRRTGVTETRWNAGNPLVTTISWTYDNLGRLVQEVYDSHDNTLDYTASYTFDLVGNRLEKSVDQGSDTTIDETITYTYDDNDRLLTETKDLLSGTDTTTTYGYTGTEQTSKTVTETATSALIVTVSSTYNLQGRLSQVVTETYSSGDVVKRETATFTYNDSGIRVGATNKVEIDDDSDPATVLVVESETETNYLIDTRNFTGYAQVIEEIQRDTATQVAQRALVYTLGKDVISQAEFDPAAAGTDAGTPLFFLYDGHGSTRMLLDAAAAVALNGASEQQIFAYDAYGVAIGFDASAAVTTLLYSGEQFDPRIGQQFLRARYYDLATGRFNRLDPFAGIPQVPQTLHKYLYTHGDPVNRVDPSGEEATLIGTMTTGAIIGGIVGGGLGVGYATIYKDAQLFSFETAKYALIGVVGGATMGAILGAGVFAASGGSAAQLFTTFKTGFQSYILKWNFYGPLVHPTTLMAAGLGFGLGVFMGWTNPDAAVGLFAAASTALTFLTDISIRGTVENASTIFPQAGPWTYDVKIFINTFVLTSTFVAISFGAGFTAGYAVGAGARLTYDALTAQE
jgi:RHS repeat-associated protein